MELTATWSYPNAIRFGAGRIKELGKAAKFAGIKRPLLVTDKGLAALPITTMVQTLMAEAGLGDAIFSEVDSNPTDTNLAAGIKAFDAGDHDGVIAMGGGSALDLGKMIAFAARQTLPIWEFEDIGTNWRKADADAIFPNICIPTTAGTGSEVGRASVITQAATHTKKVIFHPKVLPSAVICDPYLTVGMPEIITVGTGMDALAHCLEAYSSPFYHPMSQGIALEGMALVKANLPRVVKDPGDIAARAHMMSAAAMGAVAFQKGLGAIHALSHPVGAIYNTHHGMTNAVVMPYVLAFNKPAIEERVGRAAAYLDINGGYDGFCDWIAALRSDLKVPNKLAELGVAADRIEELAAMAIVDPTADGNPIELTLEAAKSLLHECI